MQDFLHVKKNLEKSYQKLSKDKIKYMNKVMNSIKELYHFFENDGVIQKCLIV